MARFVNPLTDKGFKIIFGQEISKPLLIDFLNVLLEGERSVEDISFMDKEMLPEMINGRTVIFDVLCREKDGTLFIVEMQNRQQSFFIERGIYYLCRTISRQGEKGQEWKYDLCPVYGVYFLNFTMPGLTKFRTNVILADEETGKLFSDKMKQIYLSLPLFTLSCEECVTDFQRWIYLLKYMDILDRMPFKAQKAVFDKLLDVADLNRLDPHERAQYDATLKAYRDWANCIDFAVTNAEQKGLQKGLQKGMQKGIEIGEQKGKQEEKYAVALNLKKEKVDTLTIARSTGLSVEEIEAL